LTCLPFSPKPPRLGEQRYWRWRGWTIAYSYSPGLRSEAPPLILIHGFGGSIGHWRHNLGPLSQQYPVYALDLLGFGASSKAATSYNVSLWVEQVYEFWRLVVRRQAVWVGHSIGSLVAVVGAARHPEAVRGYVAITLPDPSLRRALLPPFARPLVAAIERLFTSPLLLTPLLCAIRPPQRLRPWAAIAYENSEYVDEELLEIFSRPAYDRGAPQALSRLARGASEVEFCPNLLDLMPKMTTPGLLLWSRGDRMVPPALARPQQFGERQSHLELLELDYGGHCVHDEAAPQVNEIIGHWVASRLAEESITVR
jgi:pimeloyl-ACP methyl ester carboxylesterase